MQTSSPPAFFTLLLLISFASVNAVLFTPALPNIAQFFSVSDNTTQQTISWFLIGYAFGQLAYGPLANRSGRKSALYAGICLQIFSSLLCICAGIWQLYGLLIVGRFLLALGAGVGLKMTFTLVNECFEPHIAKQKISYLMLAFAITPGLAVAIGGFLNAHFAWQSCFYACAFYGLLLLGLVTRFPETKLQCESDALKICNLYNAYRLQFKNNTLLTSSFLMGCTSSFVYVFAALAPFIAINLLHMNSVTYGIANLLPAVGLFLGSISSAQCVKSHALPKVLGFGLGITTIGVVSMLFTMCIQLDVLYSLFLPMLIINFGLAFILANASSMAMANTTDKANGAAVMSFVNMGFATLVVLIIGLLPLHLFLLPGIYCVLCGLMFRAYKKMPA